MPGINIYRSSGENELFREVTPERMAQEAAGEKQPDAASAVVTLDPARRGQRMDGFGASFTDSAAYLIHQVLDESKREEVMVKLFDAERGIGLSVLRNPMGASDYARSIYSYNDLPEGESDPEMAKFSIAHDEEDIIPLLQTALKLNPAVKLMASPWSAPGWMKSSGSMLGGQLKPEYYAAYAEYFVRYIQAFRQHGLDICAVTPQNESLYEPLHYPSMRMPASVQAEFIRDHLKPAFVRAGIDTKILCYDHNWDRPDYPLEVLEAAPDAVDGVAWHWYGGKPAAQSQVLEAAPGKEVHFTEGSGGEWIPPFEQAFSNVIRTGIEILRNHSRSFVLWNMALDEHNGPTVPGFGRSTCRGIVQVNQATGELTYTLDYYALAHFSKVIRPGAMRIDSDCADLDIRTAAFENPDGSLGIVLFNDGEETCRVALNWPDGEELEFAISGKEAISVLRR
ncbi:glycoside hydrolase family 30 beta sandwich domain-containing protein [Saccharibacillus sp. CPCC 101409]|uniref:glycoside hydrolase family 30 protein n=1 Tax=Saccharibacillus sp. CPCC 101409 TaxID=3058041 RepID=UPI0026729980|nr:glycoside hydrolase family 30 beta sandwich domain-containing protein [Saccharibacillus sp. CPCC 101409]MDO3409452.1 glycoside hydrolase family 30 beta sandwich domain-containing protein [Saccharibacillus sp. CPCC 101409]